MAEKQSRRKSATLSLRIDKELKSAAELAAAVDRRSLTAYIERLIENDLRARTAAMPIAPRPNTRRGMWLWSVYPWLSKPRVRIPGMVISRSSVNTNSRWWWSLVPDDRDHARRIGGHRCVCAGALLFGPFLFDPRREHSSDRIPFIQASIGPWRSIAGISNSRTSASTLSSNHIPSPTKCKT
jgi:hypothetical protein